MAEKKGVYPHNLMENKEKRFFLDKYSQNFDPSQALSPVSFTVCLHKNRIHPSHGTFVPI